MRQPGLASVVSCRRSCVRYADIRIARAAYVCRSDHVLAVLFVVPCVALETLAANSQLFCLQLYYLEIERKFDSTPVVTNTYAKRETLRGDK